MQNCNTNIRLQQWEILESREGEYMSFWITAIHCLSIINVLQLFLKLLKNPMCSRLHILFFKSQQCHKHHLRSPGRENYSLVCDYAMIRIQALQAYLFIGDLRK